MTSLINPNPVYQIRVPGRVCFFGDHQDYLGLPAIAGAIDRYISLTANPNAQHQFVIHLINTNTTLQLPVNPDLYTAKPNYFFSGLKVMIDQGAQITQGFDISIVGNIPMNAGLSSSTALVTAWIKLLAEVGFPHLDITKSQIAHWSHLAEVRFFNEPGGHMDHLTIADEGLIHINNKTFQTERLESPFECVLIAESGMAKQTLQTLKNARSFAEQAIREVQIINPQFDIEKAAEGDVAHYVDAIDPQYRKHWYAAIHNHLITQQALLLIKQQGTAQSLGLLMDAHQHILEHYIENTPKAMSQMMQAARQSGAYGAKIVGSGGGGVVVALCSKENKKDVIKAFMKTGAVNSYEVQLLNA